MTVDKLIFYKLGWYDAHPRTCRSRHDERKPADMRGKLWRNHVARRNKETSSLESLFRITNNNILNSNTRTQPDSGLEISRVRLQTSDQDFE